MMRRSLAAVFAVLILASCAAAGDMKHSTFGPAVHTGDPIIGGLNNTATGTQLSVNGVLNVQAYGAKGDGTTDDTTAIQSAFNACTAGQAVRIPRASARYKITAALTNPNGCSIIGDGYYNANNPVNARFGSFGTTAVTGSVIYQATAATDGIDITNGTNQLSGITLRDFAVVGPGSGSGVGVNIGAVVSPTYMSGVRVDNVMSANFGTGFEFYGQNSTFTAIEANADTLGFRGYKNGTSLSNGVTINGYRSWFSDTCVQWDAGQSVLFENPLCEQPITNGYVLQDIESSGITGGYLENSSNTLTGDGIQIVNVSGSNGNNFVVGGHINTGTGAANCIHVEVNGANPSDTLILRNRGYNCSVGALIDSGAVNTVLLNNNFQGATTGYTDNAAAGETFAQGVYGPAGSPDKHMDYIASGDLHIKPSASGAASTGFIDLGHNSSSGVPTTASKAGEKLILNNANTANGSDDIGIFQQNGSMLALNVPTNASVGAYVQGTRYGRVSASGVWSENGGMIHSTGAAPALSSCGTSPALGSGTTNVIGDFTTGTTAAACTITFNTTQQSGMAGTPECIFQDTSTSPVTFTESTAAAPNAAYTLTFSSTVSSHVFRYICIWKN